jgi:pimeloyl-ACP methyl ester carboxylesterase
MGRDVRIEYQWTGCSDPAAELIVFLHEGLGSVAMWKDWPARVCAATGRRGLVFSRYGYGKSTARPHAEQWTNDYLLVQARDALPALFDALELQGERPVLFGHSDGGTIALLYASLYPDRVRAIAVAAPHIFVEDITLDNIEFARQAYLETNLRERLGRYHDDPDSAFWAWNDAWLAPQFRLWNIESYLDKIRCPVLAMQGEDDHYGTLEQIRGIQLRAPQTQLLVIKNCGHSPQVDQPQTVIESLADFMARLPAE